LVPRTPYAGGVPQTPTTFYTSYDLDDPTGVDRAILQFVATGGAQATLKTRCLNGPAVDQVLAQEDAPTSATLWLLQDNLETVRNVVDNAGSVINDIEYDPYGNITSVTNPSAGGAATSLATDITYTGQLYDPDTGLYYFRHRWYDARTGTFTTQDPKGFAAGDANLYRYVGNSPTNDVDPSGLKVKGVALNFQFTCALGGELSLYLLSDDQGRQALVLGYSARAGLQGDLSLAGVLSQGDLPSFIKGQAWDVSAGLKGGIGPSGGWNNRCGWFGTFGLGLGGGLSGGYGSSRVIWKNY